LNLISIHELTPSPSVAHIAIGLSSIFFEKANSHLYSPEINVDEA